MQLSLRALLLSSALAIASIATASSAHAQAVIFDTAHSLYHEAPNHSNMTVYTPGASLQVQPWDWLQVRAAWEADVVSGASVATKAGPTYAATHPGADVISAASVHDLRNSMNGGLTIKNESISLTAGYGYSTEHDYRSNSINVAARTELFEHNTQLEIAYARNFDSVCDRVQAASAAPPQLVALENSTGCFASDPLRTSRSIAIDGLQGSWSQAWTPIFATQLVYTAQIVNGFQADPYRSVLLADGVKAQEHEPENRAREALALRGNVFLKPIKAALRLGVRGYWDTWDVKALSGEAEFEKYLGEPFRLSARGRVYRQSGAVFWSDDYTGGDPPRLGPKGQYWTGDKELSPFTSFLVGLRAIYTISPNRRILGVLSGLKLGASVDMLQFDYSDFTYAGEPITKAQAYVGTLDLIALF